MRSRVIEPFRSGRAARFDPFRVFVTIASLAVGGALPTAVGAQLRGPEVRSVTFEGNETFPGDSLSRAIVTRKTECRSWVFYFPLPLCPLGVDFAVSRSQLRERDLPRDRARLVLWYRQRGFLEADVDTPTVSGTSERAGVLFQVMEGTPVIAASIDYIGAEAFEDQGLLENLPIAAGDRFSALALNATRDTITRRLTDSGYAYAEVFRNSIRPADDRYNAAVTFEIVPGPPTTYGDISVGGTENLTVATVLKTARLTTGDPYRRTEVEEATRRLYGLEIIRNATVVPDTSGVGRNTAVDIAITVQEGDLYRVRGGAGWSTAECLNVEARWTARNFFGGGRLLQVTGRVGNLLASDFRDVLCKQSGEGEFARLTGLASVDFLQPWIFSTRNTLTASIYVERQSLPDVFVRRAIGAQIGLSRVVSPQTVLTGFYRPELSELAEADDVLFCTGFLVCNPQDIEELEGANWLSPVGLNLIRDRSDDLLNPRRGYRALLDIEHAAPWTASDFRYDRIVVEGSRYKSLGRAVFATRVRGGWVGSGGFNGLVGTTTVDTVGIVHPQKRFYTGGANSVRGFAQSRLGPRVLFSDPTGLLSGVDGGGMCSPTEVQGLTCLPDQGTLLDPQPTGGTRLIEANAELRFPIGGAFEGVVFGDVGQAWGATESLELSSMEFTPGVGVRIPSPVGPIRIDVAYRFRGAENLLVVTEQIDPFDPLLHDTTDRLVVDGVPIDWVSTGQLVFLDSPFLFGANDRGLQLHVSIGQAF